MKALHYHDQLCYIPDFPAPENKSDEIIIQIASAGICNTDIEITRGYVPGFNGIPGHEFYGYVASVPDASYDSLIGKRVTAEINCGCGKCSFCKADLERHCPDRTVIGIVNRNGAFAEYISVPVPSLVPLPDTIPDDSALFIEPLAAALEIQEQMAILPDHRVLLIGDGKLAQCLALTLKPTGCSLQVAGRHEWKTVLLQQQGISTTLDHASLPDHAFDIVIEASGSSAAFGEALTKVRPRGTIVLKSTYAKGFSFNPAPVVVNEITILGSRCGRFSSAISFLENHRPDLSCLISKRFPLTDGVMAFETAQRKDTMKVVIDCILER